MGVRADHGNSRTRYLMPVWQIHPESVCKLKFQRLFKSRRHSFVDDSAANFKMSFGIRAYIRPKRPCRLSRIDFVHRSPARWSPLLRQKLIIAGMSQIYYTEISSCLKLYRRLRNALGVHGKTTRNGPLVTDLETQTPQSLPLSRQLGGGDRFTPSLLLRSETLCSAKWPFPEPHSAGS